jgi:hypothetical protein
LADAPELACDFWHLHASAPKCSKPHVPRLERFAQDAVLNVNAGCGTQSQKGVAPLYGTTYESIGLDNPESRIRVATKYLAAAGIDKKPIKLQQFRIRRNDKVSIECNCGCCVERVGGPHSTSLQLKVLKLKTDRSRR